MIESTDGNLLGNTERRDGDVGDSKLIGDRRIRSEREGREHGNEDKKKWRENRVYKESHIKLKKKSRNLSMFFSLHLSKTQKQGMNREKRQRMRV